MKQESIKNGHDPASPAQRRQQRLAQALRSNLKRRKSAERRKPREAVETGSGETD